jgi:hypothetical protein
LELSTSCEANLCANGEMQPYEAPMTSSHIPLFKTNNASL